MLKQLCAVIVGLLLSVASAPQVFASISVALDATDPGFTSNPQNVDRQWALSKARFIDAWNKTTGSRSVVVAVVDTGVDQTHEDLKDGSFVPGYDFITNQNIAVGSDSDDNGHGTLIAGVLAATANNSVGVAGTNWQLTLMPIKALDATGNGSAEQVTKAIMWAADHGAHIINLSLGGVGFGQDTALANAVTYAFRRNIVLVSAAGNDAAAVGKDLDAEPVFPICDDNGENMIIGVAAIDVNDQKPGFSNYGKSCVDVSAPGKRILSTISRDPVTGAKTAHSYAYASGTSLATPFVSGQAALLRALYPDATNKQIRDRIIASTDPIDSLNLTQCNGVCTSKLGSGRINVVASIATQIIPEGVAEGDVVEVAETGMLYLISGGRRLPLSSFVRQQRFSTVIPRKVNLSLVQTYPEGQYAPPVDGTILKKASDPTVYWVSNGLKMPILYPVFQSRGLRFDRVVTLSESEVDSLLTGKLLAPTDGALVRSTTSRTVYWVVGGVLHPISASFYRSRGLQIFPLIYYSETDVRGFPKGEAYL
ncbi:MAG: S8 family serine peptidase [Candidatus Doudnabacteria bacterium]|nr:S8 family serine peptidase [Candidatus Doudnabacteria bacterium]